MGAAGPHWCEDPVLDRDNEAERAERIWCGVRGFGVWGRGVGRVEGKDLRGIIRWNRRMRSWRSFIPPLSTQTAVQTLSSPLWNLMSEKINKFTEALSGIRIWQPLPTQLATRHFLIEITDPRFTGSRGGSLTASEFATWSSCGAYVHLSQTIHGTGMVTDICLMKMNEHDHT